MSKDWQIEFSVHRAEKEIFSLPKDLQAQFLRVSELLISFGPFNVGMPHIKGLGEGMWEIRLKGKDNIARSVFAVQHEKKIIILHTFIKKTEKAPKAALELAATRLKEWKKENLR